MDIEGWPNEAGLVEKESVARAAAAIGACDVFVFRRVTDDRFVHVGGLGRGEGWAGNIDLILAEEESARDAVSASAPIVLRADKPVRIVGPYYQREAAFVPLSGDVLVLFGAAGPGELAASQEELIEAARSVAGTIERVSSAKRLADELELLHAVRSLAQTSAVRIDEVMQHVVESAVEALACELGVLYVADIDTVKIAHQDTAPALSAEAALPAMRSLFKEATALPACIQDSSGHPLPEPLSTVEVASHYVLPVGSPPFAVLAVMHIEARPRGFTSLCREVGLRLAESAEPLLRSALTLHELEAQLDLVGRDARIDPLTKLANRRAWEEAIADRSRNPEPTGVIAVDVDGLKLTNDDRGHHFGDELLQALADTIRAGVRECDFVARIGGDEFAILLPGANELTCFSVARRIEAALAMHPGLGGHPLRASIGYATTARACSIAQAQRLADERMYAAKPDERGERRAPSAA